METANHTVIYLLVAIVCFICGILFASHIQLKDDKRSVARGIVKLDNGFYKLTTLTAGDVFK